MKTCKKCKLTKGIEYFPKDSKGKDGYGLRCKSCKNAENMARRDANRETAFSVIVESKSCNKCRTVKPGKEFFRESGSKDGLGTVCKACKTEATYAWREKNKEHYNKTVRDYNKTVPAEIRYGHEIKRRYGCTLEQYNAMLIAQEGKCAICDTMHNPAVKKGRLFVDHCHETGEVRQLLCSACKLYVGLF